MLRRLSYQKRYGYPFRWALPAEVFWRLEHAPLSVVRCWAYPKRKACERAGYKAATGMDI